MTRIPCPRRRSLTSALRAACSVGVWALLATPVPAQQLSLPALDLDVEPASQRVTLRWSEAAEAAGRTVTGVTYLGWDFTGGSTLTIEGAYVLDCDYRLRITKIPQDPGLNRQLLLLAQLFENTSGTGAPLRVDTLNIVTADSLHAFPQVFAPDLGVRISGNVGTPDGPLGTCAVTVAGVNSTLSASAGYFCTALNTVTSLSQGLQVRVAGPVDLLAIPHPLPPTVPTTTVTVTSSSQVFAIMDAMRISFGEGAAAPGDTVTWSAHYAFPPAGRVTADLEAFEGYHLWRSDLPDLSTFTLLGEIRQCDSKFEFVLLDEEESRENGVDLVYDPVARMFTATDLDVHDDFPYRYAVSTFDRGFLGNLEDLTFEGPRATSETLYPSVQSRIRGREVYVVPNPYKRHADFQQAGARIVFANLPTECTIRVYNEAAEHVITLLHGPGQTQSTSPTSREWDLRTDAGEGLKPGIYVFFVQGTDRSGAAPEAVEQTGKFIVVR